jgi:hypothetical protein
MGLLTYKEAVAALAKAQSQLRTAETQIEITDSKRHLESAQRNLNCTAKRLHQDIEYCIAQGRNDEQIIQLLDPPAEFLSQVRAQHAAHRKGPSHDASDNSASERRA